LHIKNNLHAYKCIFEHLFYNIYKILCAKFTLQVASKETSTCVKENIAVSLLNFLLYYGHIFFSYIIHWLSLLETGGISKAGSIRIPRPCSQARASSDNGLSTTSTMQFTASDFKSQLVNMFYLLPHTQFVNLQGLVMSPNIDILEPIEHFITFNPNMTLVCSSVSIDHDIMCILSGTDNYDTKFDTYTFYFLVYVANAQKAAIMFGTIIININSLNQIAFMVILCYQEYVFTYDTMLDAHSDLQSRPGEEANAICFTTLAIVNQHNGSKQDLIYKEDVVDDDIGGHHRDSKHGGSRNRIYFRFNIAKLLPLFLSLFAVLHVVSSTQSSFLQHYGNCTEKDLRYFNDTVWEAGCIYQCDMLSSISQSGKLVNFELGTFYDSSANCLNMKLCGIQKSMAVLKQNGNSHDKDDDSIYGTPLCPTNAEFLRVLFQATFCGNFESAGK